MKHKNKKTIALIVAAGCGKRSETTIPKQYVKIQNKSILDYTLKNFCDNANIDSILCVIAPDMNDLYTESITLHHKILPPVFGGNTRQESVLAGLLALKLYNPDMVLIHDAARPNIDDTLINNLIDTVTHYDGVCPAVSVTDSLRKNDGSIVDRNGLFMVQTPQVFHFDRILKAHEYCVTEHTHPEFTDDIAIANHYGLKTHFIAGSDKNYKVTFPQDFKKFELDLMMSDRILQYPDIRTAMGYDVHCLIAGDGVILGGIKIECPFKLQGHSDADVVLHAITDAILGTIAAQDIGYHFNPSDNRWKNADSSMFLRHAYQLLKNKGGIINFIDTTIICEAPKISPYRDMIRQNIAHLLNLPIDRISVKATTTEKLGFTGRGEGIATQATVTVMMPDKRYF